MEGLALRRWFGRGNARKCPALQTPNIGTKAAGGIWWTLMMNKHMRLDCFDFEILNQT
jgi:hypothetical protein